MGGRRVRSRKEIELDLAATQHELGEALNRVGILRRRLGMCLREARDHPEMTLEGARKSTETEIPRQTANRLMRDVG